MEKEDFVTLVKISAYEIWSSEGRPEGAADWFSEFLRESEENYTLVVLISLSLLNLLWGDLRFEEVDLKLVVNSIAEALLLWT